MNRFVLYDRETGMYVKNSRQYKRRLAAIDAASLENVNRNIPPGRKPDKHYQDRPQVVVHEIDDQGKFVQIHDAPPQYIIL